VDLALLVLALGSLEYLTLIQAARTPEGGPKENHPCSGCEDTRPLGVGPLCINHSLSVVSVTPPSQS